MNKNENNQQTDENNSCLEWLNIKETSKTTQIALCFNMPHTHHNEAFITHKWFPHQSAPTVSREWLNFATCHVNNLWTNAIIHGRGLLQLEQQATKKGGCYCESRCLVEYHFPPNAIFLFFLSHRIQHNPRLKRHIFPGITPSVTIWLRLFLCFKELTCGDLIFGNLRLILRFMFILLIFRCSWMGVTMRKSWCASLRRWNHRIP